MLAAILLVAVSISTVVLICEHRAQLELQDELLSELDALEGTYDPQSIVLTSTSRREAEKLALRLGATVRIASNGRFAALTLPEGTTIRDVCENDDNLDILDALSPDYQASIADITDTDEYVRQPKWADYTVSDTMYSSQSYLSYLNIGKAWSNYRGSGQTVAVIDTGIDTDHPEFAGRISEYSYNASEDRIVKDYTLSDGSYDWSLIEDAQGHGTAVAGTIAAAMDGAGTVGVAPEVTLLVIKAECDEYGSFLRTSDLVFGLYYAIERDVDVVNMSFGGFINAYADAALLALDSDILCVAAAGNNATSALSYPAADENVIGVGALAENSWGLAEYSNYGENTDLVAPGAVYTTMLGGGYGTMTGTSFSSPIVASALALLKSNYSYKYSTNEQITELLYASCYDLGDLGRDRYFGYGALDINALICEEKGTVTFNMLTDELDNIDKLFVRDHTLQDIPEPERLYAVFDGWYYDIECTEEYDLYADPFVTDLTLYASWVNDDDGVPYTYVVLEDDTVEIRSYTGKRRFISIPDIIDGHRVSSIGNSAFAGQSRLRKVDLPKYLKNIGAGAFSGCSNLVSVTLPYTVETIDSEAFCDNVRLSTVVIPSDSRLKSIGMLAFSNCSKLQRIELPGSLETVDGSAFFGAVSLQRIDVSKANSRFRSENGVLFNATMTELVAYPAGVTGEYTIPQSVLTVGAVCLRLHSGVKCRAEQCDGNRHKCLHVQLA